MVALTHMVAALFESETKLASSMGKKMSAKMFFSQQVGKVSVKGLTKCFLERNMQELVSDSEKLVFRIHP